MQNWDAAKPILRRKLIVINFYIKKEWSKINNFTSHGTRKYSKLSQKLAEGRKWQRLEHKVKYRNYKNIKQNRGFFEKYLTTLT